MCVCVFSLYPSNKTGGFVYDGHDVAGIVYAPTSDFLVLWSFIDEGYSCHSINPNVSFFTTFLLRSPPRDAGTVRHDGRRAIRGRTPPHHGSAQAGSGPRGTFNSR